MDLERKAIERIKTASEMSLQHYGKPLVCTYSGGKDSDVMLELFKRSGITFELHHNHTTADAPETVYHIRKVFKIAEEQGIKSEIEKPIYKGKRISMWTLIPQKLMPPSRIVRYCCSILKETGCPNRMIATGVRWAESSKRKNRSAFEALGKTMKEGIRVSDEKMLLTDNDDTRKLFEQCSLKAKTVVNPIIDWQHRDIWEYIRAEHIETNPLYWKGYKRVGCIGCPMAGKKRWKEFADYPTFKLNYMKAFDRMLLERRKKGLTFKWTTGEEVFLWWMEDRNISGQQDFQIGKTGELSW